MTDYQKELKRAKRVCREFLRVAFTDERLAALLAHAQLGRLEFYSCCCFIGSSTSDHPLKRGIVGADIDEIKHLVIARKKWSDKFESSPEIAYQFLRQPPNEDGWRDWSDSLGCRRLIPMIRREIKRRERVHYEHELQRSDNSRQDGAAERSHLPVLAQRV